MIWRLLKKNISAAQIIGYAAASLIGLTIIMSAIRFYNDAGASLAGKNGENSLLNNDFLVISRPVSLLNTFGLGSAGGIAPADIADLEQQPWVSKVGKFEAANFNVAASVSFQGKGLSSYLFLEATPDEFIDQIPSGWSFSAADGVDAEVPIMLSKDYLALYNFGFAGSQGLPQVSEAIISKVPITLYLSGNGRRDTMRGRIVGFSNRLNTIAVPYDFMQWANARYSSPDKVGNPSRLIVEVDKPGDPAIQQYLDKHGYEVAGDKLDNSKLAFFLTLLTTIVVIIGAIISALSLFILMLSITLLLQRNREKNANLLLLGYAPRQIAATYFKLVAGVNIAIYACACLLTAWASSLWQKPLSQLGLSSSSIMIPMLWGAAIMLAITLLNFASISRSIRKLP